MAGGSGGLGGRREEGGADVGKGFEAGVGRWWDRSRRGRLASVAVRLGVWALSMVRGPIGREK